MKDIPAYWVLEVDGMYGNICVDYTTAERVSHALEKPGDAVDLLRFNDIAGSPHRVVTSRIAGMWYSDPEIRENHRQLNKAREDENKLSQGWE